MLRCRHPRKREFSRRRLPSASAQHPTAAYSRAVRLHLEAEKCQGHNRCYALAPELFDVDDYGQAVLLVDGELPDALHDKARLAAANCPEFAIKVLED